MKKRILVGMPAFFVALLIGYIIVPEIHTVLTTATSAVPSTESEPIQPSVSTASAEKSKDDPVPEFTDLPNFDDYDYPVSDNLIDVFEMGGTYRESEVVAENGESWLTLMDRNGKYTLVRAKTKVHKTNSVGYPGDEPNVRLTFDQAGTPIFATKNLGMLKPGAVTTLYHRPSSEEIERRNLPISSMEAGFSRTFDLDGNEFRYILRVSKGRTKDGTQVGVLVLENGPVTQVITQNYDEIIGELYWVGDLDHDGKLDLYLDEFNEKGYFFGKLYLSSAASEGKLVRLVATFGTAGC